MAEAKAGLKSRVEAELAAAVNDEELKVLRDRFSAEERAMEHTIDHTVHQFSAALDVEYNVSARLLRRAVCAPARSIAPTICVPFFHPLLCLWFQFLSQ